MQHAPANTPVMILGNKCDLEDDREVSEERGRMVSIIIMGYKKNVNAWLMYLSIKIISKCSIDRFQFVRALYSLKLYLYSICY